MIPQISQAADDLIVACEVSSRATFEKKYRRPEWPGGASGITIGIGYDLGYADNAKIDRDWGGRLPDTMIDAMIPCLGVTGDRARAMVAAVRPKIDVSWDAAIYVYEHHDIPEWTQRVCSAIPGADRLTPDCIGALTSLAYNRGASFKNAGDRYREMRAIRSHVMAGELSLVDDEIRNMKRLWPNVRGLQIRRDKESDLWNIGLQPQPATPLPKSKPKEAPAPLAPPAGGGGGKEGGIGTVATGAAEQAAQHGGLNPWIVGGIVVAGVVITVGAIAYARHRNAQPVVARMKG